MDATPSQSFTVRRHDGSTFQSPVAPPTLPVVPRSGEPVRIRTAVIDLTPPSFTVKPKPPAPIPVGYTPPGQTGRARPLASTTMQDRLRVQEHGPKNPLKPGRAPDFKWAWAELFIAAVRAGNFLNVAARLTGKSPNTVTMWLSLGRRSTRGALAEFAQRVAQAEAEFEAQSVGYVTHASRINPDLALRYLKLRHPERYAERQSMTLRPGRPDGRQSDDERGPETLRQAEEALGALSTDGIVTLYEKAFGEFSPEERDGIVGLDAEGAGLRGAEAGDVPGAFESVSSTGGRLLPPDQESALDRE